MDVKSTLHVGAPGALTSLSVWAMDLEVIVEGASEAFSGQHLKVRS